MNRKNAVVEIGNESLIPEIEKEILSLKKGEESSFEVLYPKDFPITEAAEKNVQCTLKVNKILKKGDLVKRGQHVADAGDLVKSSCGGGMEHLHFHMSKRKGSVPNAWGSWRYLGKS